jgi:A/G-specific adenine glycosylase
VLVSELMLQQTTAATVSARFKPFLQRFPDLQSLAAAEESEVLHAWQGLGYYRRARALRAAAREAMEDHGGRLPAEVDALRSLPGIGDYTAKAIAAIAHDRPVLPIDGNGVRVFARLFSIETPLPRAARIVKAFAEAFEPCERPADLAQALMDLGATVCRPAKPHCARCPLAGDCAGRSKGLAESLPRRAPKAARLLRQGVAFLLIRPDGAILFRRRPAEGLLGGLHELPTSPWRPAPLDRDAALAEAPAAAAWRLRDRPVRHLFTHFALELDLAEGATDDPPPGLWRSPEAFGELALPTVMKKLLKHSGKL